MKTKLLKFNGLMTIVVIALLAVMFIGCSSDEDFGYYVGENFIKFKEMPSSKIYVQAKEKQEESEHCVKYGYGYIITKEMAYKYNYYYMSKFYNDNIIILPTIIYS